jgi:hypothetical protein
MVIETQTQQTSFGTLTSNARVLPFATSLFAKLYYVVVNYFE